MALTGLLEPSLKLILFGGKGGVGKTTFASGAGLYLANNNKNTLLISTDPAQGGYRFHTCSAYSRDRRGNGIQDDSGLYRGREI
jgi:hypothetical protein